MVFPSCPYLSRRSLFLWSVVNSRPSSVFHQDASLSFINQAPTDTTARRLRKESDEQHASPCGSGSYENVSRTGSSFREANNYQSGVKHRRMTRRSSRRPSDARSMSPVPQPQEDPLLSPGPPLEVFQVKATILPSTTAVTVHRLLRMRIISYCCSLSRSLLGSTLRGIQRFVVKPLGRLLLVLTLTGLGWIDLIGRFLIFWWLRLPDRREIEHRQIAASQYVESLEELLPASTSEPDHLPKRQPPGEQLLAEHGGVRTTDRTDGMGDTSSTDEIERYLDDYFKQLHGNRNLISGLMNNMNIRLLQVVPEHPLDFSDL